MKKSMSSVLAASAAPKSRPEVAAAAAAPEPKARQASRMGKKYLSMSVHPPVHRQFSVMAAELERNKEELMREALNLLFEFYKRPPIA